MNHEVMNESLGVGDGGRRCQLLLKVATKQIVVEGRQRRASPAKDPIADRGLLAGLPLNVGQKSTAAGQKIRRSQCRPRNRRQSVPTARPPWR